MEVYQWFSKLLEFNLHPKIWNQKENGPWWSEGFQISCLEFGNKFPTRVTSNSPGTNQTTTKLCPVSPGGFFYLFFLMLARPEVVSHPSQEQGSQSPEVHPWRSVHCHAGSEPGTQKPANFGAKITCQAYEQRCDFLSVTHKSQNLDEHLKMLQLFTCWVLSIIARASAISFWFTPQRFATFAWHLWWTFMPHAGRQNKRCQDNEGCKGLGRSRCWPGTEISHLKSSWDGTQVVFWFPMETILVFSSGQRLHFQIHQPLQVQATKTTSHHLSDKL